MKYLGLSQYPELLKTGQVVRDQLKKNYGLYFTIWDRIMGTLRTDYDKAFEKLKLRKKTLEEIRK